MCCVLPAHWDVMWCDVHCIQVSKLSRVIYPSARLSLFLSSNCRTLKTCLDSEEVAKWSQVQLSEVALSVVSFYGGWVKWAIQLINWTFLPRYLQTAMKPNRVWQTDWKECLNVWNECILEWSESWLMTCPDCDNSSSTLFLMRCQPVAASGSHQDTTSVR